MDHFINYFLNIQKLDWPASECAKDIRQSDTDSHIQQHNINTNKKKIAKKLVLTTKKGDKSAKLEQT